MNSAWSVGVPLLASATCGLAALLLVIPIVEWMTIERGDGYRREGFERERRHRLRQRSWLYRWFEPVIDDWAAALARSPSITQRGIARDLGIVADSVGWTASEWMATRQLQAGLVATCAGVGLVCVGRNQVGMWLLPLIVVGLYSVAFQFARRGLRQEAQEVRSSIFGSLPFSIDLIVLMLQAGGTFREAVESLARLTGSESWRNHLTLFLRDLDRGLPRVPALTNLGLRLHMPEIDSLVFSVKQGETLGSSLLQVLSTQSQQMRFRQSQAIERAAERVKVQFVWPSTLSVFASFITMLAPMMLSIGQELGRTW